MFFISGGLSANLLIVSSNEVTLPRQSALSGGACPLLTFWSTQVPLEGAVDGLGWLLLPLASGIALLSSAAKSPREKAGVFSAIVVGRFGAPGPEEAPEELGGGGRVGGGTVG